MINFHITKYLRPSPFFFIPIAPPRGTLRSAGGYGIDYFNDTLTVRFAGQQWMK